MRRPSREQEGGKTDHGADFTPVLSPISKDVIRNMCAQQIGSVNNLDRKSSGEIVVVEFGPCGPKIRISNQYSAEKN